MNKTQQTAQILWRILKGEQISATDSIDSLSLVFGHQNMVPYREQNKLELFMDVISHQPESARIIKYWQKHFNKTNEVPKALALRFVNEVLGSLEDVERLFPQGAYSGNDTIQYNSPTDHKVKRVLTRKNGWSLHMTTKGKGRYNCIRQQLLCEPGGLVLISPEGIYDYQRDESCRIWSYQWIYFSHDESWSRWLQWPEAGPGIYHLSTSGKTQKSLHNLFLECANASTSNTKYTGELTKNLTEQILIRCFQIQPAETTANTPEKIIQAVQYIAEHFATNFDLQDLSSEVCLSRPQLSALFKKHMGTSVMRWRDERRMSKACELLAYTALPINQIAQTVGYKDPLYFSRTFHQHLSCSPREYRKQRSEH